jgi:very-short-patch-repair endonuclease
LNVLRFDNRQILTEIDAVVERVYYAVEQRLELIKLESPKSPFEKGDFP